MGVADRRTDEDGLIDADTKHVCTNKDLWPVRQFPSLSAYSPNQPPVLARLACLSCCGLDHLLRGPPMGD